MGPSRFLVGPSSNMLIWADHSLKHLGTLVVVGEQLTKMGLTVEIACIQTRRLAIVGKEFLWLMEKKKEGTN